MGRSINAPLTAICTSGTKLPDVAPSFLSAPPEFAVVAIKLAESGEALVVRGYETTGQGREVSVQMPDWAQHAATADLMEKEQSALSIRQGAVNFRCAPHEIVTLLLYT
jgi:alpha-mannosidase